MIIRQIIKDSAFYGGADFITKLVAFFCFPIVASAFSPSEFGFLELIFTVISIVGLIVSCGLNNAVQRYYWDKDIKECERPSIVTTGFLYQILLGLLFIILSIIIVPMFEFEIMELDLPFSTLAITAALIVMACRQWSQYILDVTRLHFAPKNFLILAFFYRPLPMISGVIVIVFLQSGIDGLLLTNAFALLLFLPLGIWFISKDFRLRKCNWYWAKKLIKFGHPFIYVGIAHWLFGYIDRWMLASMASVEEVGVYSIAFRFASIVLFLSVAFGQAWSPLAIKIRTDHPVYYRSIYGQILLLLIFAMLLVGGIISLFAGEGIFLIMPSDYWASALPMIILSFGIIIKSTQQITAIGISLEKKTFLFARIAWLTAFTNIIGNYFLIPKFGATGAAVATFFSYLLITLSYLYFTQKIHPLEIPWRPLSVLISLGLLIAFISIYFLNNSVQIEIVSLKVVVIIFCFSIGWKILPSNSFKMIKS
jgi:O-antigen/teichoic acid export membrane protein